MGLRYIIGSTGSGKTTLCLNEIMYGDFDDKNLILIVPEQFTLESEKRLIEMSNAGAIIKCQVLSFNRLAFHLFRELGKSGTKILEQSGKTMLLRKIVLKLSKELEYFARASNKQGFMQNLSELISEFYRFNITPEKLADYLPSIQEKENVYIKFRDLHKIYVEYTDFIRDKYLSTDETLDLLSDLISTSDYLKNAVVWLDNFNSFTPQEYKVIGKLIKHCERFNICISTNADRIKFSYLKEYDPYFETKVTINKITRLASENNLKIEKHVYLGENRRHKNNSEIKFLTDNFFKLESGAYEAECSNIEVLKAQNIYSEISETAKKIHRLVKNNGFRYREIAVISASVEENERIIRNIFHSYEIPCFFDTSSDILSHPMTELIRSLVEIVVGNYSYESVFRFLKTNMTPIKRDEIDILENYALAYGIKSYKWRLKRWEYGFNEFDEEAVHRIRDEFLGILDVFASGLTYNTKLSIKDFCIKIYRTLDFLQVTKTIEGWIFSTEDNVILRQHKQIWTKITSMFEKMVEILGDEIVTLKEFGKILDAGLEEIEMSIIPPSKDCVVVGDYKRTRLPEMRAFFFIGVNEGKVPALIREKGIITDDERIFLREKGLELEPDSGRKFMRENLLIYESFTKTTEFLRFSYSIGTLLGKSMQPSSVIYKLKTMFPSIKEMAASDNDSTDMPKPAFEALGRALRNYSRGGAIEDKDLDLYSYFKKNDDFSDRLSVIEKLLFFERSPKYLNESSAKRLYGKELITSVTRLERFVKCPFSYFMQYSLAAKERKQFELNQMDLGSLFHNVIERFSKNLEESNLSFRDVDRKQIDGMVEACVDELAKETGSEIFLSTAKLKYALKRVKRISKQSIWALSEHVKKGSFEPLANELEFSFESPMTSVVIELNESKRIVITGRIDRVDFYDYDGSKYIKVIDYKSGGTKFDLTDIYYGMQLQILLYLDAFMKNAPQIFNNQNLKILPGGVFYFNINDPVLDYTSMVDETVEFLKLKEFRLNGLVLKNEHIVSAMDNEIDGDSIIIPVGLKKDMDFTSRSSVATNSEFENILNFINERIKLLADEIFKGNIDVYPYKKGNKTGCDYCGYSAVCQIDGLNRTNKYNVFKKAELDNF